MPGGLPHLTALQSAAKAANRTAVQVVVPYLILSSLWIWLADLIAEKAMDGSRQLAVTETLTDWAFVAVTAVLLFGLVRRSALVLASRQAEARMITDCAGDAIWTWASDQRFLYANPAACRITGYDLKEILRMSVTDPLVEEDRAAVPDHLAMLDSTDFIRREWRVRRKDGSVISLDVTSQSLPDGRYLGVGRDLTERRLALEAQAALAGAKEAVRALVDASPRALAMLVRTGDGELVIEWVNRMFAEIFDRSADSILGHPLAALLPKIDGSASPFVVDERQASHLDLVLANSRGPIEIQLVFTPVRDGHSRFSMILVTAVNVSADRTAARRDAERHLLESLGRMASRIAHEINNVLQPIMSRASLAAHASRSNSVAMAHIAEIQNGVRNGRDIVRSVLAVASRSAVARQATRLEEEVARALELFRASVPRRIALESDLAPTGGQVSLAAGELFQIVSNLVKNAIDAIDGEGSILVEVRPWAVEAQAAAGGPPPGRYARLVVADNGCGMAPKTLLHATDPFFTTKAVGKGVGLGLSTIQALVSSLGGAIGISSSPGTGTSVSVLLPFCLPDA